MAFVQRDRERQQSSSRGERTGDGGFVRYRSIYGCAGGGGTSIDRRVDDRGIQPGRG